MYLNLCFHNIVNTEKELESVYWLTLKRFTEVKTVIENFIEKTYPNCSGIKYYFDDGFDSIEKIILQKFHFKFEHITVAIPTDFIGHPRRLSEKSLKNLHKIGINVVPHGVSHAALAIYKDNNLINTPFGGIYQNKEYGKTNVLTENEVLYQLSESKVVISRIVGNADEFVLPYCLYNNETLKINKKHNLYKFIVSCEDTLKLGPEVTDRVLIDSNQSDDSILEKVSLFFERNSMKLT